MNKEDKSDTHSEFSVNAIPILGSTRKGSLLEKRNRTELIKAISVNKKK